MRRTLLILCVLAAGSCHAQEVHERRNWFSDPFFQISNSIINCPVPAGPYITEPERKVQSHHRAERGASCWLAGMCDRSSSYEYDQEIAKNLHLKLAQSKAFLNSSLWVTVQSRVVYIEGCVRDQTVANDLEAIARGVPNVQQAIAAVYEGPASNSPYKQLNPP